MSWNKSSNQPNMFPSRLLREDYFQQSLPPTVYVRNYDFLHIDRGTTEFLHGALFGMRSQL